MTARDPLPRTESGDLLLGHVLAAGDTPPGRRIAVRVGSRRARSNAVWAPAESRTTRPRRRSLMRHGLLPTSGDLAPRRVRMHP
jgi:hypothetical protein